MSLKNGAAWIRSRRDGRRPSGEDACSPELPTFLVIGAAKSGTTSLHEYLRQHPAIYMPRRKEPSFFACAAMERTDRDTAEGPVEPWRASWVRSWEQYRRLFADAGGATAAGEVSPAYMSIQGSAEQIAARLPEVKLIAVLRDPAERAHSHWLMRRKTNELDEDFGVFLDRAIEELERGDRNVLWHGFYHRQLRPYFSLFPREQLHIVLFEQVRNDLPATLRGIFGFLGVDEQFLPANLEARNPGGLPRHPALSVVLNLEKRLAHHLSTTVPAPLKELNARFLTTRRGMPSLSPGHRQRLSRLYASDTLSLTELVDMDLNRWLPAPRGHGAASA